MTLRLTRFTISGGFFLLLGWVTCPNGMAQPGARRHTDSLLHVLSSRWEALPDSSQFQVYYDLAAWHPGLDTAMHYAEQMQQLAVQRSAPRQEGRAYLAMAKIYDVQARYEQSDSLLQLAQQRLTLNNAPVEYAEILRRMYRVKLFRGLPQEALQLAQERLAINQQRNDPEALARTYFDIASAYWRLDRYVESVSFYTKATELALTLQDTLLLADAYAGLGVVYNRMKEPAQAVYYDSLAMHIYRQQNLPEIFDIYNNMGIGLQRLGKYDAALLALDSSIIRMSAYGYARYTYVPLSNKGEIYRLQGQFQKSLDTLHRSLTMLRALADSHPNQAALNTEIAQTHLAAGNLDSTRFYAERGLAAARQFAIPYRIAEASEVLHEATAGLGDHAAAYRHLLTQKNIEDSLASAENARKIGQLEERLRAQQEAAQKKAAQTTAARQQARLQSIQYYGLSAFLLGLFLLFLVVKRFQVAWSHAFLFLTVILTYEFVIITLDPFILRFSKGLPLLTLLANFLLALCFLPVHQGLERYIAQKKEGHPQPRIRTARQ